MESTQQPQRGQIYIIKNNLNSMVYIGQAIKYRKNIKIEGYHKRWKEHIYSAQTNPTYHMDRCMQELGVENFYVELLEECSMEDIDDREVFYMLQYSSIVPNGYNVVLGNPHRTCNPEHTSLALKKYYSDIAKKIQHSQSHINKFHELDHMKQVIQVDIKPICEGGSFKLVYMYILYDDGSSHRRRYGGIHINFDEAYKRCLTDSQQIVSNNLINDHVLHDQLDMRCQGIEEACRVRVVLQKMRGIELVAILIYFKSLKPCKRMVFGGKTISFNDAYIRAMSFITKLNVPTENVEVDSKVVATLSK